MGVPGAAGELIHGARTAVALYRRRVFIALDMTDAFQNISRAAVLERHATIPGASGATCFLHRLLAPSSLLILGSGLKRLFEDRRGDFR